MTPFEPVLDQRHVRPVVEPDLGTKIRYRLGWSISEEYRGWVEQDIESRSFGLWQLWPVLLGQAGAVWLVNRFVDGFDPWPYLIGALIGAPVVMIFFTDFRRRRVLAWHEKRWTRQRERDESPDLRRSP